MIDGEVQKRQVQGINLPPQPECCCGCSVQTGTKAIAIFSLLMDALTVLIIVLLLVHGLDQSYAYDEIVVGVTIGIAVFLAICTVLDIAFNVLLLKGAQQAKVKHLRLWITYTKVLMGICIGCFVLSVVTLSPGIVGEGIAIAKYWYFISVVKQLEADVEANPSRYTKTNVLLA